MKKMTTTLVAIFLVASAASAHRLDEYLEATMISLDADRMHASIRLTPGVGVFPAVLREIDTNADGAISDSEQRAYGKEVLRDLSFAIDGIRIRPHLVSLYFPSIAEMKDGLGEIRLEIEADWPRGGMNRKLTYQNHHQFPIAAYLVNCLVPRDPNIRIAAQNRNYSQSSYELDFTDNAVGRSRLLSGFSGPTGTAALLLLAGIVTFCRRTRRDPSAHGN